MRLPSRTCSSLRTTVFKDSPADTGHPRVGCTIACKVALPAVPPLSANLRDFPESLCSGCSFGEVLPPAFQSEPQEARVYRWLVSHLGRLRSFCLRVSGAVAPSAPRRAWSLPQSMYLTSPAGRSQSPQRRTQDFLLPPLESKPTQMVMSSPVT